MTNKELISKFLINKAAFFLGLVNRQPYSVAFSKVSILILPGWSDASTNSTFNNLRNILSRGINLPNSFWHIYTHCFALDTTATIYALPLCISLIANNHRLLELIDEKDTNSYLETIPYYTNPLVLKKANYPKDGIYKIYERYIDYINNSKNQDRIIEVLSEAGLLEEYQSTLLDKTKLGILLCAMVILIRNEAMRILN